MSVEGGTAQRALACIVAAADLAYAGPTLHLDVEAGVLHLPDRVVEVVLTTPRPGQVGVVEDLLVDRAFPDVPGEATVLAELGDLLVTTVADLHQVLGAAALARAAGAGAGAVRAGLRACGPAGP